MSETDLVYGILDDNLILLPADFARELAADYRTLDAARTYGDARAAVLTQLELPGTSAQALEESGHEDSDLYDPSELDDWPTPIATWALDVLPDELEDVGEQYEGMMVDPILMIDPSGEANVVTEVTRLGFAITRDDDLISSLDR